MTRNMRYKLKPIGTVVRACTLVLSSMGMVMMPGAEGSSAEEWNCATYGCRSASRAVIRFAGLNCATRPYAMSADLLLDVQVT